MSDVSSTHAWGLTRIQEIGLMQGCSSDFESASLSHLSFSCVRVFFFPALVLGFFPFLFSFLFLFSCSIVKENS